MFLMRSYGALLRGYEKVSFVGNNAGKFYEETPKENCEVAFN